jgi:hypothetical protein
MVLEAVVMLMVMSVDDTKLMNASEMTLYVTAHLL